MHLRSSYKTIGTLATLLLLSQLIYAQNKVKAVPFTRPITGKVINQLGEPLIDITVANTRTGISTITNSKGIFYFKVLKPNTFLKVYGINIKTDSFFVRRIRDILIQVEEKITTNVSVVAIHQVPPFNINLTTP